MAKGLPYPTSDPLGQALFWYPQEEGQGKGSVNNPNRPPLPELGPNASPKDRELYAQIQQLYSGTFPGGGEAFLDRLNFGNQSAGTDFARAGYRDPAILNFLQAQNNAANYENKYEFFGDPFSTAGLLALGGAAAGGALGAGATGAVAAGEAGAVGAADVGGAGAAGLGVEGLGGAGSLGATAPAIGGGAAAAGGGGVLGTGLTGAQAAKLAASGISLVGGLAGGAAAGGGSNTVAPPGSTEEQVPGVLSSADILGQGRNLALAGVPLQVGSVLEALATLRAKASGSAAEILPGVIEQLGTLRSQYAGASKAISRKLGYAGGGQVQKEQGRILGQATRQYAGLIQGEQQAGQAGLYKTLGGFAPLVSGVAREPSRSVNTSPFNTNAESYGALLAGIGSGAKKLFGRKPYTGSLDVTADQGGYRESETAVDLLPPS